jgi:SAM-dependent methyltransferase
MKCRHCNMELKHVFVDLINCPPSNDMLKKEQLNEPEPFYPLKIFVCDNCFLVQVDEMKEAEKIFDSEYTYFSSYSTSWLAHSKKYVDMMMSRFGFNENSLVLEIASNDGYLLQYFKEYNVPVLGIDPTANTAAVAIEKGIDTIVDFFGADFAKKQLVDKGIKADLILGNNVLAHVPDINDFVKGMKLALKNRGIITMEFPHLMKLVEECQFDTIYHEHFSYLSFTAVKRIFGHQGLEMFHVEELPTHGGSLRIFAKHKEDNSKDISGNVTNLLRREEEAKMTTLGYYSNFQERVDKIKYNVWEFLIKARREGKKVIGYGAAAKGNTLLNYCGIKGNDLIQFVVDASPHKQNKYLPASHIFVREINSIKEYKPDYVIILPWNLKNEISEQLNYIREWGGKFVTFIPEINIL